MRSSSVRWQRLKVASQRPLSGLMHGFRIPRSALPPDPAHPEGPVVERNGDRAIPEGIGKRVELLPGDRQRAFVHWQIDSNGTQRAVATGTRDLCLQVADVTAQMEATDQPRMLEEIMVGNGATERYRPVTACDRDHRLEVG